MNKSAIIETIQEEKNCSLFLQSFYLQLSYNWRALEKQNSWVRKL